MANRIGALSKRDGRRAGDGLTHGVHGIGDTVAVSINTTESVITDLDAYTDRLIAALRPE